MYCKLYIDMQQMFRYGLVYNGKQCKYTAFVHMHLQEKNTKKRLKLKAWWWKKDDWFNNIVQTLFFIYVSIYWHNND